MNVMYKFPLKKFSAIVLASLMLTPRIAPMQPSEGFSEKIEIQPQPKKIVVLNSSGVLNGNILQIVAVKSEEKKAADYLRHLFGKLNPGNLKTIGAVEPDGKSWTLILELAGQEPGAQSYSVNCFPETKTIKITSPGQLGLLYGAVTFSKMIRTDGRAVKINLCDIEDRPDFQRRIISAVFTPENTEEILDYALMNKMSSVAIASRNFPWYEITEDYRVILNKIKSWKEKYGGPGVMQMHNVYSGKMIEISNPSDVDNLKKVIEEGIKSGIDQCMILSDDTPPFEFGKGYILPGKKDREKFSGMAEAHCFLMNELRGWIGKGFRDQEIYYVPPFYTYEDMNLGDIELYKDTPWQEEAYGPLCNFLDYIGRNLPDDVFTVWCGPNVRSRKITKSDLDDWTAKMAGKVPFLWDNTIYSHSPFISTPMFEAFDNDFPDEFYRMTAGRGMFVNGDAASEDSKASMITVNDYLWNTAEYEPGISIGNAMRNLYGGSNAELLLSFARTERALRLLIGERKLWFQTDSLWSDIRKIRFTTEKNPFYYHLNYSRLKALRMQLKYSVPLPQNKSEFISECINLVEKREQIIKSVGENNPALAVRIKGMMLPLPDFNSMQ